LEQHAGKTETTTLNGAANADHTVARQIGIWHQKSSSRAWVSFEKKEPEKKSDNVPEKEGLQTKKYRALSVKPTGEHRSSKARRGSQKKDPLYEGQNTSDRPSRQPGVSQSTRRDLTKARESSLSPFRGRAFV